MSSPDPQSPSALQCPLPLAHTHVLMAHGGGGKLMQQLIARIFRAEFTNPVLDLEHDGAVLSASWQKLAFTTDSYVVQPLFFPGGDIGTLAVNGTVNDLVMCGAQPRWLSAAFILEEGLPLDTLQRIVQSMQRTAVHARVQFVTGDTKVVEKGKGDSLFINTAGIGLVPPHLDINPRQIQAGDAILLSGDVGRHGVAILSVRQGLEFEANIQSDCAPLNHLIQPLIDANITLHCLRDLTRGGLAAALNEIAQSSQLHLHVDEHTVPVLEPVQGACEILGLDPLYVANEGRCVLFVPAGETTRALDLLRSHPLGFNAACIGSVETSPGGLVSLKSRLGTTRVLDLLSGEQLPRIC